MLVKDVTYMVNIVRLSSLLQKKRKENLPKVSTR
jgi:hypothetical protein